MRSDIDSMMKSGGGAPSFQNVPVSGLTMEGYKAPASASTPMPNVGSFSVPAAPVLAPTPAQAPASVAPVVKDVAPIQDPSSAAAVPGADPTSEEFTPEPVSSNNLVPIIIVVIVAIGAIAVVGYFAYTIFAK
jgi:hypothetical protein